MQSNATTVAAYLQSLSPERRDAIDVVRQIVGKNVPQGFEEGMLHGMIAWYVPEARYPAAKTYNKQPLMIAGLASQKNYAALYLMPVYGDSKARTEFEDAHKQAGKKLDMGKSCVRYIAADDLALDAVATAAGRFDVEAWVALYEKSRTLTAAGKKKAASKSTKKAPSKKPAKKAKASKKASSKKASSKKKATSKKGKKRR